MIELKTLKDIYEDAPTPNHNLEAYNRILKQEAIKDIKKITFAIQNNGAEMPKFLCPFGEIENWRGHVTSIIEYIKWKFNISEEDLKDGKG